MVKKILFTLTPAFNPNDGGVQRTTWKLGSYFSEHGYEVSYYSLAHEGHVEAKHGTLYHSKKSGKNGNPANISHMERVIENIEPDIVINQMPYEDELRNALYHLKKEHSFKLLGCLRNSLFSFKNNARDSMQQNMPGPIFKLLDHKPGIELIKLRHWWKHRGYLKDILDTHDHYILLAPPNREELKHFVGNYKSEKVAAIPNSIPGVHNNALDKKEKIILHVGRLNIPQKRSDLLLDVWQKVHHRLPDWKFVIVGDGPYMEKMQKTIKEQNIPRVTLEGFQKPEPYYEKAALFVMTSAYEGFPNVLLEAQSFGCATVLFNSYKALDWIVHDGKDVILAEPFDTASMADKIAELAPNEQQLGSIQQEALENAARFTLPEVGKQWEQFFKKITEP